MDGSLNAAREGHGGRIEVLEGRFGRRMRSEAGRTPIATEILVSGVFSNRLDQVLIAVQVILRAGLRGSLRGGR